MTPFPVVPFTLAGGVGLEAAVVVVGPTVADAAAEAVVGEVGVDCTLAEAGPAELVDDGPPRCFAPATIATVAIAVVARPTTSGSTHRRGGGTTDGSSSTTARLDATGAGRFAGCASFSVGATGEGPFVIAFAALPATTPAERCVAFAGGG